MGSKFSSKSAGRLRHDPSGLPRSECANELVEDVLALFLTGIGQRGQVFNNGQRNIGNCFRRNFAVKEK
jgi:hypothetical protein